MKIFSPPEIYNDPNPVGLDAEIASIQAKLACNTWMEAIFGKALRQKRQLTSDETKNLLNQDTGLRGPALYNLFFPQGRKQGMDIDLSFDDSYATYGFFYARDPINANTKQNSFDWTEQNVEVAQPLSFIFFANINKLINTSADIVTSEILKTGILYQLNKCPKVCVHTMYENIDKVWADFDLTARMPNFSKFPYYCLRVDLTVTYFTFPDNGNSIFNPNLYNDSSRATTTPNTTNNYPNSN